MRHHSRSILASTAASLVLAGALLTTLLPACSARRDTPTAPGTSVAVPDRIARREALSSAILTQETVSSLLLGIRGVVGTGAALDAAGRPVVQVFLARAGVPGIPAAINGVRVVTEVTGEFRPFALTDRIRPVSIGTSLGNDNECIPGTVGAIVLRSGTRYLLGPNHLLARRNAAAIGELIVQPSRVDASAACLPSPTMNKVARLTEFEPLRFDGSDNAMDGAIAELTTTDVACATPPGYYGAPSSVVADAVPDLMVEKLGRTTGLTHAAIKSVNVKLNITYPEGKAHLVGQILTDKAFGAFGDSGSLVVTDDGTARPVGMLIGGGNNGTGIVTPIGVLLARFGATLCGS